ncbi:hypothetical protein LCGC14_1153340 [marine sediment metagenome]|uniref:Portal protein n=1 Tax=marine sediment metagenome TaxID=412755 RepID=A0A0F9MI15_9ZZZZ
MVKPSYKRKPGKKEITGPQTVSFSFGDSTLVRSYTTVGTYAQLRAVRKNPTVQLARALLVSCIQAGSWNIEADDDVPTEIKEFFGHVLSLREELIYNAVAYGKVDFGWCGFEKIFHTDGNRIMIETLKPLLHDMTIVLVTKHGRFNGYRQNSMGWGVMNPQAGTVGPAYPLNIPIEKCLHIAFGVEAGYLYGMPLLENIRATMDMWDECNDGARRYDKKLAGTHWIVKYPPGEGTLDGESVDNGVIAAQILTALESSGSVAMPTTAAQVLQEIVNAEVGNLYAWSVELLDDKGKKQASFNDRLKYLDAQKVRGLGFPERAILEGSFGTKAEAGIHGDLALQNIEATDRQIVRMLNQQLINQLLVLNYGTEMIGKVRLVAAPLVDKQISFFRDVYKELSKTDADIDMQALRDKLDIATEVGGSEKDNDDDEEKRNAD